MNSASTVDQWNKIARLRSRMRINIDGKENIRANSEISIHNYPRPGKKKIWKLIKNYWLRVTDCELRVARFDLMGDPSPLISDS